MSTKRIAAALALALSATTFVAAPSWADHDYYEDECQGGGCGNEREEDYSGAGCKYFCPDLQDSPVQMGDVTLCMPFSTCEPRRDEERQPRR